MATTDIDSFEAPMSAQQTLAADLVRCMGCESALNVCRTNGWAGVLEIIQRDFLDRDPSQTG